jgi:hypothetical protein
MFTPDQPGIDSPRVRRGLPPAAFGSSAHISYREAFAPGPYDERLAAGLRPKCRRTDEDPPGAKIDNHPSIRCRRRAYSPTVIALGKSGDMVERLETPGAATRPVAWELGQERRPPWRARDCVEALELE